MKKAVSLIILSLIMLLGGCKSYVQKKWDAKKAETEREKLLNSEAKGSHVWYHERQVNRKFQETAVQNRGTPNY